MNKDLYAACCQCPRNCNVNRRKESRLGFCAEPEKIRAAVACLHFGEEPPITAKGGSGTIFVTGCNLRCAFCQNYQISQQGMGEELSAEQFAEICLHLEAAGAENINIVTGSHAVPALAEALSKAKESGLSVPVCWNSSAYEKPETLKLLDGLVDIWLPDLKTLNREVSANVFRAADYPERATESILYMLEKSPIKLKTVTPPDSTTAPYEKMLSGVIIRHLFLPGRLDDTIFTLDWLKHNADGKAYISLMSQYTPVPFEEDAKSAAYRKKALSAIDNRLVSKEEFADLQDILEAYDFEFLFYQELEQDTSWLPDFTCRQPFSNELAKPVWHWKEGFIKST